MGCCLSASTGCRVRSGEAHRIKKVTQHTRQKLLLPQQVGHLVWKPLWQCCKHQQSAILPKQRDRKCKHQQRRNSRTPKTKHCNHGFDSVGIGNQTRGELCTDREWKGAQTAEGFVNADASKTTTQRLFADGPTVAYIHTKQFACVELKDTFLTRGAIANDPGQLKSAIPAVAAKKRVALLSLQMS